MNDKKIQDSSQLTGKRLRAERLRRKKTQEEFGRILGISPSYLGAIERGKRPVSKNMMKLLHERLGLSYDYLMDGHETVSQAIQNTLHEPGGYRVRRDLSLMLSGCTNDEALECYDLLQTYLTHIRSHRPAQDEPPSAGSVISSADIP